MSQSQSFDPSNSTEVNSEEAAQVVSGGTLPDVNPLVFEASTLDGNSVIDLSMLNSLEPSQSLDSYFGNDVSEKSDVDVCESENVGNLPSVDVPESLNSHGTADRVAKEVPEPLDEELAEKAVEQTAEVAAEISFDSASPIGQEDSHAENFEPEVDLDDLFASDETEDITPEKIVVKHSPDPTPVDKSELVEPKSELVEPKRGSSRNGWSSRKRSWSSQNWLPLNPLKPNRPIWNHPTPRSVVGACRQR